MKSVFNGHGYWMNDDRASGGKLSEDDTVGCGHCHAAMTKQTYLAEPVHCAHCGEKVGIMCGCADRLRTHGCEVFIRTIERTLDSNYRKVQNARILGI
jgi:hypothetical protein